MTAQSPHAFDRSWATRAIPSTLWSVGSDPIDPGDRWPTPIVSRAVTEFCHPGGRVALLPASAPATRGALTVMPSDVAEALATVESLGRTGQIELAVPGAERWPAELVLASLLDSNLDSMAAAERVAELAVRQLSEGGLLVVLSRCHHGRDGALHDPAASVVAAAQAADLLYLQHIVAAPITSTTIAAPNTPAPSHGAHVLVHTDVFVFLNPRPAPTQ
ncbi:hypothetical protein NOVA_27345 [Nocardia nova]|uniref:hypothetical protein n=1 Tax=Nocardia nova TaxID=37330 RepID=UPI001C492DE9|nr:hypothetical protein [Nocardia nova]MBV7706507.1 hypothetical protein [Nocardia nova]